jgi:xanthine dehydrogenase large subunit
MSLPAERSVGRAEPHESARAHVTGAAKYVDDMWTNLANVAHAWPITLPHAHARVCAIDAAAALRQPGVLTLLTAADVPGQSDVGPARRDEPLFPTEVCFHGQAVAWLLAETEAQARSAAALVRIDCEVLPAILSIEAALAANSFLTEPERMGRGDPARTLATAPQRLRGELFIGGQEHFYLETQAALALLDENESVFVQSSTQHPSETQEIVARVLGRPRSEVIVQCLRMGGAFGGKEVQANTWAAIAALGALKLRRPVRVRLSRQHDMRMTGKRHPFLARFDVGFDRTGKLQALQLQLWSDGGYSLDLSAPVLARALFHSDNCYLVPDVEMIGRVCRTHHSSHTAFRGFGGPQGMLVIEDILARIAQRLGLPPHLVRERNFYQAGDLTHYGQSVRDADRIERIWRELKISSDFEARSSAIARCNASEPHKKRGLAITPVKFGISFTTAFYNQAGALVLIYKDGSVQVNHGGTEMGQGLHTKVAQIAADALGLPLAQVRIMPTRTDKVPNTSATAASSGTDLNGAAVLAACQTLRERLVAVAAGLFAVAPEQIAFESGRVFARPNSSAAISFGELVEKAYLERVQLSATGYYRTPDLHFDKATGQGKPFHYFAYGAAVSEVELDRFTGQYRLLRADLLHDVGDTLSPLIDRGQIEGGFIQGVGWLTSEELVWDDAGALMTAGASTYKLPSLAECPEIFNVALLSRAGEPEVVHRSKAVGEPPLMLALSVREALRAAIEAYGGERGDGSEQAEPRALPSPITPEVAFFALEQARARVKPMAAE